MLVLYATGGGLTDPASPDGGIVPLNAPPPTLRLPASVTIEGQPAKVLFAGGAPGLIAGVVQINVQISAGTSSGNSVPVTL